MAEEEGLFSVNNNSYKKNTKIGVWFRLPCATSACKTRFPAPCTLKLFRRIWDNACASLEAPVFVFTLELNECGYSKLYIIAAQYLITP